MHSVPFGHNPSAPYRNAHAASSPIYHRFARSRDLAEPFGSLLCNRPNTGKRSEP